jgi:hypothetical protein
MPKGRAKRNLRSEAAGASAPRLERRLRFQRWQDGLAANGQTRGTRYWPEVAGPMTNAAKSIFHVEGV